MSRMLSKEALAREFHLTSFFSPLKELTISLSVQLPPCGIDASSLT